MNKKTKRMYSMMNKKGLQIGNAFAAVVVVSFIIIAMGVIIGEWNTFYGSGLPVSSLDKYNKLTEMEGISASYKGNLTTNSPDLGSNFDSNTLKLAYGIITNIFVPFDVTFALFSSVANEFNIPDYIVITMFTLMIFAFIFSLIALIFRLFRTSA